nr:MAG TPA: hypothetical protein [Caudoviricetes sp.]
MVFINTSMIRRLNSWSNRSPLQNDFSHMFISSSVYRILLAIFNLARSISRSHLAA